MHNPLVLHRTLLTTQYTAADLRWRATHALIAVDEPPRPARADARNRLRPAIA